MPTLPRVVVVVAAAAAATESCSGASPSPLTEISGRPGLAVVEKELIPPLLLGRLPPRSPRAPKLRPEPRISSSSCVATAALRDGGASIIESTASLVAAACAALRLLKPDTMASGARMTSLSLSQPLSLEPLLPLAAERMLPPPPPWQSCRLPEFLDRGLPTAADPVFEEAEAVEGDPHGMEPMPPPPPFEADRFNSRCCEANRNARSLECRGFVCARAGWHRVELDVSGQPN